MMRKCYEIFDKSYLKDIACVKICRFFNCNFILKKDIKNIEKSTVFLEKDMIKANFRNKKFLKKKSYCYEKKECFEIFLSKS